MNNNFGYLNSDPPPLPFLGLLEKRKRDKGSVLENNITTYKRMRLTSEIIGKVTQDMRLILCLLPNPLIIICERQIHRYSRRGHGV